MSTCDDAVTVVRGRSGTELSFLMPLYRREATVGPAVASVLVQRGVVAEVIISDDHSAADKMERVKRWERHPKAGLRSAG